MIPIGGQSSRAWILPPPWVPALRSGQDLISLTAVILLKLSQAELCTPIEQAPSPGTGGRGQGLPGSSGRLLSRSLSCCWQGQGIKHGSEPGSQDKDRMSALGAGLGPDRSEAVFQSKPRFRMGRNIWGQMGTGSEAETWTSQATCQLCFSRTCGHLRGRPFPRAQARGVPQV